jgi:DNA-binding response OmpR family regulator
MAQHGVAAEPLLVIAPLGVRARDWCTELEHNGFLVDVANTVDNGIALARDSGIALMLIATAEMGLGAIRALRDEGNTAGILAVTCADDTASTVDAIESGADLCVVDTCSGAELVARLTALARRQHTQARGQRTLWTLGDLVVDPLSRMVTRGDCRIPMSPREFAILVALLRRRGRVVTRQELWRDVWREGPRPKIQHLAALIFKLRNKLDPDNRATSYIRTIRSWGYLIPYE